MRTLSKAVELWYADLVGAQGLGERTAQEYRRHLRGVLDDLAEHLSCAASEVPLAVRRTDLAAALAAWRFRPDARFKDPAAAPVERSALSVGRRVAALRSFYSWCVAEELLESSPADRLKPPPVPERTPRALPAGAVRDVLAAARLSRLPERDLLLVALHLTCGLSLEEASSLEVPSPGATHVTVSSRSRSRTVALSPLARSALEAYLPVRERQLANADLSSDRLLLAARTRLDGHERNGSPRRTLDPRKASLLEALERTFERAGLEPGIGSHALRVAFARAALESGSHSVAALQQQLGHASLTSLRNWMGDTAGELQAAADRHPFGQL